MNIVGPTQHSKFLNCFTTFAPVSLSLMFDVWLLFVKHGKTVKGAGAA